MNAEPEKLFSPRTVSETWDVPETDLRWARRKLRLRLGRTHAARFLMGFCVVAVTSAMVWPLLPRRYESTAAVILHPADAEVSSASESPQFMRQPLDENAIQSEIDRIGSPALLSAVIAQHHLAEDPEFRGGVITWLKRKLFGESAASETVLRRRVQDHLTVFRERRSYTVKFGFRSSDGVKAAAMARTLLNAYLADQLARKREVINGLTSWLSERADRLRAKAEESQQAVEDFLVQSGLMDKGADIALEHELATMSSEAALAQSRAMDAQTRADALSELQKAGKLDTAPEVLASPLIQRIKEKISETRSAISPVNVPQKAIEAELAAEADRILQGVKTEARTSAQRAISLERAIKKIRDEMTERHAFELRLAALRQEARADRKALDDALMRLKAETARANAVRPDVDVIADPEVPTSPVFPNPLLAILGTLMAACLAGMALIWRPIVGWCRRLLAY
jgi:polysaccharide biosynthesis transport protein